MKIVLDKIFCREAYINNRGEDRLFCARPMLENGIITEVYNFLINYFDESFGKEFNLINPKYPIQIG